MSVSSKKLREMSEMEINKIPRDSLTDIRFIKSDTSLPIEIRIEKYLEQVKNPYCFLCGNTPVKISFNSNGNDLVTILESYLKRLRQQ